MKRLVPTLIILLGVLSGWAALTAFQSSVDQRPPKVSDDLKARVRLELGLEEISNNVRLTKTTWQKSGFGTVMVATFTFHNGNEIAVKDIQVSCDLSAPSGTLISTAAETIYRRLPPKADTIVEDFNMGFVNHQSATARCMVTKAAPSA